MARKSGVVAVDGRMIDAPMITRANRILAYAGITDTYQEGEHHD
jgi:citrate lyase beta subunit